MTDSSEQSKKVFSGYVIFSQFILEVLVFIGGAVALGLYLDNLCGTTCLFLVIFIILFAFVPIYNLVKRVNLKDEKRS